MLFETPDGFIEKKEIEYLTDYKRPSDQIRWLDLNGWRYEVGASGHPKVAQEEFRRKMVAGAKKTAHHVEPNFSWMEKNA